MKTGLGVDARLYKGGVTALARRRARVIGGVSGRAPARDARFADTHLIPLDLPGYPDLHFYLKDGWGHPTGSFKHRLARALFLYALGNGWLREGGTVVEASSGSIVISEAGRLGRRVGGSTGTNFVGMLYLAGRMKAGQSGAMVGLLCDSGERYRNT
jgi:cysteine synthase